MVPYCLTYNVWIWYFKIVNQFFNQERFPSISDAVSRTGLLLWNALTDFLSLNFKSF